MLKREEYIKTVRRPYPPYYWSIMWKGTSIPKLFKPLVGLKISLKQQVYTNGLVYYSFAEREQVGGKIFKQLLNKKRFEVMQRLLIERENVLINATSKNLKTFSQAYMSYA